MVGRRGIHGCIRCINQKSGQKSSLQKSRRRVAKMAVPVQCFEFVEGEAPPVRLSAAALVMRVQQAVQWN